jgi:hypothetical protein
VERAVILKLTGEREAKRGDEKMILKDTKKAQSGGRRLENRGSAVFYYYNYSNNSNFNNKNDKIKILMIGNNASLTVTFFFFFTFFLKKTERR